MRVACLLAASALALPAAAAAPDPAAAAHPISDPSAETRPVLAVAPSADDIVKYYPTLARMYEIVGDALVTCTVRPNGQGRDCKATAESPPGLGFGKGAEKLAATFKFRPGTVNGAPVERPWSTRIVFRLDEDPPAEPPDATLSPEVMDLAERYVRADDLMPHPDPAAAAAAAKRDCAANGGAYCDQFAKAAEAAAVEETARLQSAVIAWVAKTYSEDELKTLASGGAVHDAALIEKAGRLARALPEIEARAGRDHHVLIRKHYCEIVACPVLAAAR